MTVVLTAALDTPVEPPMMAEIVPFWASTEVGVITPVVPLTVPADEPHGEMMGVVLTGGQRQNHRG